MFIALTTSTWRSSGAPCFLITGCYKHIAPPEQEHVAPLEQEHVAPPEQEHVGIYLWLLVLR